MLRWLSNLAGTMRTAFGIAKATISAAGLTAARTFTLPDQSGTVLLLESINSGFTTSYRIYARDNSGDIFDGLIIDQWVNDNILAATEAGDILSVLGLEDVARLTANTFEGNQTVNNASGDSSIIISQQGDIDSAWTLKNNHATGRLTFTDDPAGTRVPFKFGLNGVDNLLRVGIAATDLVDTAGGFRSSSATLGIGYSTGAGGTVTQATSKSTGVTLNKVCGEITMNGAALAAATIVSFTLTNSAIAATDVLVLNHVATGTLGAYGLNASCAAGSAQINVRNNTAGSLSQAIVLRFSVIKGVTS